MAIKVGINGFGRVGRVVFRTCLEHPDVEVSLINDPAIDVDYICYLMKYDSTHGTLKGDISHNEHEIKINGLCIKVCQEKLPTSVPWHTSGVQYVVEASGMFTNVDKASGHLIHDGVKRVIVTAPSIDVPMVILGINDHKITPEHKVISCGSSTLYCLAPIVKILEDNYGVEEGFITSIHAMTPSLKPLDGLCLKGKHWRDHRSITQNIIPAATGACKALGRIIPAVRDRLCGLAFRVPIANVSVMDLTVRLKKFTSIENIAADVEKFRKLYKETIIKTNRDEVVSSDFIGDSYSCILDVGSSMQLKPDAFKLICWYENEYSYACRVIDLILFSEVQLQMTEQCKSQATYVRPKNRRQDMDQQTDINVVEVPFAKTNINDDEKLQTDVLPRLQARRRPINNSAPVTSSSRDPVAMNKIWHDDTSVARQNLASFFQMTSAAKALNKPAVCSRAQEHLEKVKQEFSKMVNITENLLKKSYTSKFNLNGLDMANEDRLNLKKSKTSTPESALFENKQLETNKLTRTYGSSFDIGGDNIFSCSTINSKNIFYNNSSLETVESMAFDKDKSGYSMLNDNRITIEPDKQTSLTSEFLKKNLDAIKPQNENIQNTVDKEKKYEIINKNNNFVSKAFTNIFGGISKNIQFTSAAYPSVHKIKEIDNEELVEQNSKKKSLQETVEAQNTNISHTNPLTSNINITFHKIPLLTKVDHVIQNELGHVKQESENIDTSVCEIKKQDNQNEGDQTQEIKEQRGNPENDQCDDYVRHDDSKADDEGNKDDGEQTDKVSCALVPDSDVLHDTMSQNSSLPNKHKQDIYDKLDSASTSSTSFEIGRRKSQIINITDLTSSLEDIDRLDKICRIMEISDELSDKLFSALNQNPPDATSANVSEKRWSFKDLCEKVNLDEFCNEVFGN